MINSIPLSLYIHIPWCIKKCPYCDFNSHALRNSIPEIDYVSQLIKDLESDIKGASDRKLVSIFFGGGTPSLFSAAAIADILDAIQKRISFIEDIEITLEANPGTVEQEKFIGYNAAGINRLSIGCQSFNTKHLKKLGRIHNHDEAIKAALAAKNAGINNFNLDLMFGLPDQTIDEALADLQTAIDLSPTHISWYQLTLEPNTLFYREPPRLPEDDDIADMHIAGIELLNKYGFNQYEVSAFSKPSYPCRHNRNYWQFGDYLGIGAGAHSKLTDVISKKITRTMKHKHPQQYLSAGNFIATETVIATGQLAFEFMLNALRLYQPIPYSLFEERTGLVIQEIIPTLEKLHEKDLMILDKNYFYPSALGRRFLNDVIRAFL